jgi:hypothetical protein
MTPEAKTLLLECYRRMEEHRTTPQPPAWRKWDRANYDETIEHGPDYAFGSWFEYSSEAARMRYRRAIDELVGNGMMTTYSRHGGRLTKIMLTPEGEQIARELKP